MLVTAGAVQSAIQLARKIVEQDPSSSQGWQALAWAYQHDDFGRPFRGNWNANEAEKFYREALKLDPDDFMAKVNLAILLQYNPKGQLFGDGARLAETIQLYREILKTNPNPVLEQNLAMWLLPISNRGKGIARCRAAPTSATAKAPAAARNTWP